MRWKQAELCRKIDHQLSSQNWCQLWIISDTFDNIWIIIAIFMFYIYKSKYLEKWICRMSCVCLVFSDLPAIDLPADWFFTETGQKDKSRNQLQEKSSALAGASRRHHHHYEIMTLSRRIKKIKSKDNSPNLHTD